MTKVKAALVQTNAAPDMAKCIAEASALIEEAAGEGAQFILTPENVCGQYDRAADKQAAAQREDSHPGLARFREQATKLGVWLLIGSLSIKTEEPRVANRSYLIAPDGTIAAWYDKIHMFDVDLADGESYRESATVRPGERAVMAETDFGRVGLSVCYDLRFPHLYRTLAKAGADILTIPAAFTVPTGKAHWETLLRARAIESGAFVLAPAQTGEHDGGRHTYGHSLAVAPWGEVIADGGGAVGVSLVELDLDRVAEARQMVPALGHDREFHLDTAHIAHRASVAAE
jgi:predicted amidohydrolase